MSKPRTSETTADRLRYLRHSAGITPYRMEKLAALSGGHAKLLECGKRRLGAEVATRLSRTFGCSIDWLLTGDGLRPAKDKIRSAVSEAEKRFENFKQVG